MDAFVSEFVRARASGEVPDEAADLLSLLLNSVDEGRGMDLEQLHHEVLNICIGAFETTTNTLSWALYLLARHPAAEAELHDEVDRVLGGRTPGVDDLPALRYTRMVIDETLRLYSPAYQFMRRARVSDVVGGYPLPAGTNVLFNSYLLHRHPDFWPDAETFDPHRFDPDAVSARPNHAYLPFGSGQRVCIGKHFALMELTLVLATLAGRYRFTLPPGAPEVGVDALITLHPRGGVHLRLERRAVGGR
jgi:cytochrome P450